VHFRRGLVLVEMQRYAAAESALSEAVRLRPQHMAALFELGVACERQGRLEASEAAFRKLLVLDPRNAQAHNYLGYMLADRGVRLEEALREIELALKEEPKNTAYLDSRGWALYRLGRWDEARAVLESAIGQGGQDPVMHEHLGDVLNSLKLYRLAHKAYQDALAGDPNNEGLKSKLHNVDQQLH